VPALQPGLRGGVVQEDARHRATEFLKELYAAGDIDAGRRPVSPARAHADAPP
jgi:uncharacterized membrane protein